jgi:glutathione peroxidase
VTFPMSSKLDVNGPKRHALYAFLTAPENGFPGDVGWNFEKFLISRDGTVLKRYPSGTKPDDKGLMQDIADAL